MVAGIPISGLSAYFGLTWTGLVYDIILIAAAVASGYLGPDGKNLRLVRQHDPVLSVRVPNKIKITLYNETSEEISGRIRDEPPPLFIASRKEFPISIPAGSAAEMTYMLTPSERGTDFFRGTFLRLKCPFGLVERQLRLGTEQEIRIYPNVLAMRQFDLLNQKGKLNQIGIRKSRMRGLGSDFESLREYAVGDDFRKIDWKATARRGKLIVRQFEQERNQPVIICIDIGRRMLSEVNGVTKLDYVLDSDACPGSVCGERLRRPPRVFGHGEAIHSARTGQKPVGVHYRGNPRLDRRTGRERPCRRLQFSILAVEAPVAIGELYGRRGSSSGQASCHRVRPDCASPPGPARPKFPIPS